MKLLTLLFLSTTLAAQTPAGAPQNEVPTTMPPGKMVPAPVQKDGGEPESPRATWLPNAASAAADQKAPTASALTNLASALDDPELVLFDQPEADGPIWVRGSNYKASFHLGGWSFIAKPLPGAEALAPLHFRLAAVTVGERPLTVRAGRPTRSDRRIEYAHGDVVERLDASGVGIEQSLVFASLPTRGELLVDFAVDTTLADLPHEGGVAFGDDHHRVTYSQAIAIDAQGERVRCQTHRIGRHIVIRVPADFVERAALPLVIDPLVASGYPATSSSGDIADPDIAAFDYVMLVFPSLLTIESWVVVWSHYFGANDWDCYAVNLDDNLNFLAGVNNTIVIDFTTSGWQRPRIATIDGVKRALVVSQVRSGGSPTKVRGRMLTLNQTTAVAGPQFDIANSSVDSLHPDVGGDNVGQLVIFAGGYFTVVWEHAYSQTDHDIYARQVDTSGNLRPGPLLIQINTLNQSNPSISNVCGSRLNQTEERNVIVYQQRFNAFDEDIYGAMLTWDGVVVPVNGSSTFPIDTSTARDTLPQVSSPTHMDSSGQRRILAVYERSSNGGDIAATCFDQQGAILSRANLSVLENAGSRLLWPQRRPSVDTDGNRFGVAYHDVYTGNGNDLDTRMSLVRLAGTSLIVEEAGVWLAASGNAELNVQVVSRYTVKGSVGNPSFCTVNDRDNTNSTFAVDARAYQSVAPTSMTFRATACGNRAIIAQGTTVIGGTVTFLSEPLAPLLGYLAGAAVSVPFGPCPGCTFGVSGSFVAGGTLTVAIPPNPGLIGVPLSVQGVGYDAAGPCLGQLHLTDTVDFTVQ